MTYASRLFCHREMDKVELSSLPLVGIYLGHYLSHEISMPLANPPPSGPRFVKVIKTEEKGSDVNLATHLLSDAYENRFDVAVIVSNDSDLLAPMNVVTQRLRKKVGILNPHQKPAVVLKRAATFYKPIREGVLRDSQFPATLTDAQGIFHKPARW